MNRQDIERWLKDKPFMYANANTAHAWPEDFILDCFNDLAPKWVSVDSSKPKQGVRVLLRTKFDESCPFVVGYWGCGEWEACTVNVYPTNPDSCVDTLFGSEDVTHWMPLPTPPKTKLEGGE